MKRRALTPVAAACALLAVGALAWIVLAGGDDDDGGAGVDLDNGAVLTAGRSNAYPRGIDGWDGIFLAADSLNSRGWGTTVLRRAPDGGEKKSFAIPLTGVVGVRIGTHADEPDTLFALGSRGEEMTLASANPETGQLRPEFGKGGLLTLGRGIPQALAVSHNHHIAAADGASRRGEAQVVRFGPGGEPPWRVRIRLPGVTDPVRVVALGWTGETRHLLVAGEVLENGGATARPFLSSLARTRNGESATTVVASAAGARWKSLAVHHDGSATMVGNARSDGRAVIATARFGPNIELDTAYGTGGVALTPVAKGDAFTGAAAAAPDGGLYVAANTGDRAQLVHLRKDGSVDARFRRPPAPGRATAIALEDDGSVLFVTAVWVNSRQTVGLRRLQGLG